MDTRKAFFLYVDDWLASAAIEGMTPAEEGAYIHLLCRCWQQADCGLPADDAALARLSRLGDAWHNGSGVKLRQCFSERDGRLYNARLLKEREHQDAYRTRISGVRSEAAKQRWAKAASAEQMHSKSNASGMQPKLKLKPNNKSKAKNPELQVVETARSLCPLPTNGNGRASAHFAAFWQEYPKKVGKRPALKAYERAVKGHGHEAIMAGLSKWKPSREWEDPQYVPHASTFLNQERFLEEPASITAEIPAWRKEKLDAAPHPSMIL